MNTLSQTFPGKDQEQQTSLGTEKAGSGGEDVQISPPHTDRPEGPFEHSGETSGWTREEEAEKKEQDQQ
jgi:hypothetical protein